MASEKQVKRVLAVNVAAEGLPPIPNRGLEVTVPESLASDWDQRGMTEKPARVGRRQAQEQPPADAPAGQGVKGPQEPKGTANVQE